MTSIHTAPNEVRRFIVENQPVRGYWVDLESAWQELRAHQDYPPAVRDLLGEAVGAAVLLAATLKFEGTLTLQIEGCGHVRLLVAQCTHDFRVRAVARLNQEGAADQPDGSAQREPAAQAHQAGQPGFVDLGIPPAGSDPCARMSEATAAAVSQAFRRLVGEQGRVLVTIEAAEREMRYQGIVPLAGDSLSECLENYFASSEQLPTRLRLAADDRRAVGLLVQKLPERGGEEPDAESEAAIAWQDAQRGIESVRPAELVYASLHNVLAGRFGKQDLRVFKGAPVQFACRCSQARVTSVLKTLGVEEVRDVLREHGAVEVTCEFCQRPFRFDAFAIEQLFAPASPSEEPRSIH
jgi:molecular chaperone Hsp33